MKSILCFDIGGTKIAYGLVQDGKIRYHKIHPISEVRNDLLNFLENVCKDFRRNSYDAIVIGVPAVVKDNKIYSSPNLREIEGMDMVDVLGKNLNVRVLVERDVNLQILGESFYGVGIGYENLLGIYVGTGLGLGIILKGEIYKGSSGAAGEIGHIHYPAGENLMCGCGKFDCVELYAAGIGLKRISETSGCPLDRIFECEEAKDGIRGFLSALSFAISTAANLFDPDAIVIGGGVIENAHFPWDELVHLTYEKVRAPFPRSNLKILRASLGYKAGLLGGFIYAQKRREIV